jgi:hypothetical protein
MQRISTLLFTLPVAFAWLCAQSQAMEMRVALVIGNGAYQNVPRLPNPRNDATDVATVLKRTGFDTMLAIDLDKAGIEEATIRFARAARAADVALFYYSGHALQFAGANFLVPVDAKMTDETDLRRMTRVDDIVADLQQAKSLRILVLDSCRDNPLADQLRRSIGTTRALPLQRGLAKIDAALGMIVAYATQAGRTAEDGTGRNSPYTSAFLKNIETPDEIGVVFRRISGDVYEATGRTQLPELSLSLTGEFYLRGKAEIVVKPSSGNSSPKTSSDELAEKAWAATQNTTSIAVLEDFIRRFGNTVYGSMARARLEELKRSRVVIVPPNNPPPNNPPPNNPPSSNPPPDNPFEEYFDDFFGNRRPR